VPGGRVLAGKSLGPDGYFHKNGAKCILGQQPAGEETVRCSELIQFGGDDASAADENHLPVAHGFKLQLPR
jgi:hypothetical protein